MTKAGAVSHCTHVCSFLQNECSAFCKMNVQLCRVIMLAARWLAYLVDLRRPEAVAAGVALILRRLALVYSGGSDLLVQHDPWNDIFRGSQYCNLPTFALRMSTSVFVHPRRVTCLCILACFCMSSVSKRRYDRCSWLHRHLAPCLVA